jgi:hypothetical protein
MAVSNCFERVFVVLRGGFLLARRLPYWLYSGKFWLICDESNKILYKSEAIFTN